MRHLTILFLTIVLLDSMMGQPVHQEFAVQTSFKPVVHALRLRLNSSSPIGCYSSSK
jgi:hypothetical protein